ncbi:choice-of-anchor D domain-containing protein [uncultured Dokdonia sp.]|uniref:choice-of-anchor D domain-containing protein n=1 Tax=uncultured Dokdonia sp. TaxID=575653 RepID=UPI0026107D69|nr:choice-of-anchor D domain-containing protein [uncultured Dokdonia sp.]
MKKITSYSTLCTFVLSILFSIQPLFALNNTASPVTAEGEEDVYACTGTSITSFPYNESFEGGLGDWVQPTGDSGNWTQRSGTTPSNNTGPFQASNGTFYYYTEASNGGGNLGPNATAFLRSPCIDLSAETAAYFSFDYHMYGNRTGRLTLQVSDNAGTTWTDLFTVNGQQQSAENRPWRKEIVDISAYAGNTINLRFVGRTGTGFDSDISVDNVVVTTDPQYCGSMAIVNFTTGISRVNVNTINNSTGTATSGYSDFTSISTDLTTGTDYTITTEVNTAGNNDFVTNVWIDWNQDKDFDDPGESYDLGTSFSAASAPTSNSPLSFTVPVSATIGTTRMRVSHRFGTTTPGSCDEDNNFFGEVEDYSINVVSGVPQPEMDITGLGNSISDGDTTPSTADDTDFGNVLVGNTNENTFTIFNTGTLDLNLTGASPYLTITGADAGEFSITNIPSNTVDALTGTTTFAITYTPSAIGTHNAVVTIANDDSDENPYNFNIRGTGTGPEPEMTITGMGNIINDGDTTPTFVDGTDFGFLLTGNTTFSDFIISNSGSADLLLTGPSPYVTITGLGAGQYTLTTIPSTSTIPSSGGSTTFRITYNPGIIGTHNATVTIANNDSDENPYTFDITGQASVVLSPEIDITGLSNPIADGDVTPDITDGTDFGTVDVGITNINDFTIINNGSGVLTLSGASPYITIIGADAAQFSVSSIPDNAINPSESTTFQISYIPTAAGTHNATIRIVNNDSNEGVYTFDIQGTAVINTDPKYTIYYENFDTNNGGWTVSNPGGNSVWTYGTNTTETGTEGNYWYTSNYNNYADNSLTRVTSPVIDLTSYTNLRVQVDIRHDTSNDTKDGFRMEYSTNGGTTWTPLGAYAASPTDYWYNTDNVTALGSGVDGWAGRNSDSGSSATQSSFVIAAINMPSTLDNNSQARFRFTFASDGDGVTDDGVNFDNVLILGNPITPFTNPSLGPGDVTSNLRLWLKSNVGIAETDGNAVSTWNDEAFDNDARVANNSAPTYYDNSTENINHNPVLNFSTSNDTELKGKGGFFTDEYWLVVQPDGNVNSTSSQETIISGRVTPEDFAEDGTGFWINPGSIRFIAVDNIISHMIGSTPSNLASSDGINYGRAYESSTDSYDNEVMIFNVKYDPVANLSTIYKNGIRIDNYAGRTYNQSTGFSDGDLPYSSIDNSMYILGVGRITIMGTPFDSHFNGKITEMISYASPNSAIDQSRIQSYLAIKNGITLHDTNSTTATELGDENYVDSSNNVIWNTVSNSGFNYDIAGIGRDDNSGLNQKQSTSVNPGAIVTMGLTDVYATNNENIATNPNVIPDRNFLMWGNDDAPLAAATPIVVDMSAGIAGLNTIVDFSSIERTWKVVETGTVGTVKVSIPEISLSATITPPGDYLMFVSDTPTFSPTSEYRIMNINGANLETTYDFIGTKYITFGYAPEYVYPRSITFDGVQDYMDADDSLDLTGPFTVSAWINHSDRGYTVVSKRDAAFAEGYAIDIINTRRVRVRWRNAGGTMQEIRTTTPIPNDVWHQFAITYDGTTANVYIDGVLDNTETLDPPVSNDRHFLIGAVDERAPTNFYEGTIDELRVWDIALSQDQIRFIMNQEIEENTDLRVRGRIVPPTISKNEFATTDWDDVAAYFPMNIYTFTNVKDESNNNLIAAIKNLDTVDYQTAPLPYVSVTAGDWANQTTWENGTGFQVPNSPSIADNTVNVEWNIVQTAHNVTTQANNTVLALDVQANELSIENDSKIEVSHYLKVDGVLDLVDESQLIQTENSDLDLTSIGSLEKDQQGTADTYSYNIWSSPVSVINGTQINLDYSIANVMNDGTDPNNPSIMNFSGGLNGAPSSPITISAYWMFKYSNGLEQFQYVGPFGSVGVGEGYTMKGPGSGAITDPQNYVFVGKPNNSTDAEAIVVPALADRNYIVGNPFPSALDANDFINDNPHLDGTLYLWEHYGGGNHITADYQAGYALYTLSGGTPAVSHPDVAQIGGGTKTPDRYVAVGQGFFVAAVSDGDIVFSNTQRNFVRESGASIFLFGEEQEGESDSNQVNTPIAQLDDSDLDAPDTRQKFRIGFDSPSLYHRQLLITVDPNTTFGVDRTYDGQIEFGPGEDMTWDLEDKKFVIQGVPNITDVTEFPLVVTLPQSGPITIGIDALENVDTETTTVYLKDRVQNTTTNLLDGDYEITLEAGDHYNRYFIVFRTDADEDETEEEETEEETEDEDSDWDEEDADWEEETNWEEEEDQTSGTGENSGTFEENQTEDTNEDTSNEDQEQGEGTSGTTNDDTSNDTEEETQEEQGENSDPTTVQEENVSLEEETAIQTVTVNFDAQGKFILVTKNERNHIKNAALFSMLGQVIQQWKPETGTTTIQLPVSNISKGAYILRLETDMGLFTERLIIH